MALTNLYPYSVRVNSFLRPVELSGRTDKELVTGVYIIDYKKDITANIAGPRSTLQAARCTLGLPEWRFRPCATKAGFEAGFGQDYAQ
jgi:hypothetical protein